MAVGFVRIVTSRRLYEDPTPMTVAPDFIEQLTAHPRCRTASLSGIHLPEVMRLCRAASATGKGVADAQHAALAVSEGGTWITRDGDFARFEPHGLRWQHLVLQ